MLADKPFTTTLPVADLQRAKKFYADTLGLPIEREGPDLPEIAFRCGGGTTLEVFMSNGRSDGSFTQGGWYVDDIEQGMAELRSKGIVFEEFDFPDLKTENGIAIFSTESYGSAKGAWFRDPDGNMLSLFEVEGT